MKKILIIFTALIAMTLSARADKIDDAFAKIKAIEDVQVQELPKEALTSMGLDNATLVMFFTPTSVQAIKNIVEAIPSDVTSVKLDDGSKLFYLPADGKKYNAMIYIIGETNLVVKLVCPADKFEAIKNEGFK